VVKLPREERAKVKLMLTISAFDKMGRLPEQAPGGAPALEVGPAIRAFHVAPAQVSLGAVPAAFREWRAQPAQGRRVMRLPALLGAVAMHAAGVALILLVEWSLVAPVPLPAITVSLNFEPAPQPTVSAPPEPAPPVAAAAVPQEPPPEEVIPVPPPPPVAEATPEPPPVTAPSETAPPPEPAPAVEASPPKPAAVAKTRPKAPAAPHAPQQRAPAPSAPESTPEAAVAAAPSAEAPAASPPAVVAAAPIVPPRPVDFAHGNQKPVYPALAKSRGLQGLVLLRVDVAPSGTPLAVTVATSSGHAILDDAAVAAVKTWRFSPATQAGVPVAAVADVPIQFRMAD
jgi:protein TonB